MAHYVALVRPTLRRIPGTANQFYEEHFIAASECYGEGEELGYMFYRCKGGTFPYWFLGRQVAVAEVCTDYEPLRQVLSTRAPQIIYALHREPGYMNLYVHTPEADAPGVWAVFESDIYDRTRLFGCGGDVRFLHYAQWEVHDQHTLERHLLMAKMRSMGIVF